MALRATLDAHVANLGYALLLKQIRPDIQNATEADIQAAASSTIPNVPVLFWSFRFMVAFGFWFIALFATAFWLSARQRLNRYRWFLQAAFFTLPLPWLAAELGWIVAEYGRQPWVIEGVFLLIILAYTAWVYRVMRGPVTEQQITADSKTAY